MKLLDFMNLFEVFRTSSFDPWRSHLARVSPDTREFIAIAGRGAGKSIIDALLLVYYASRPYEKRAPGERLFAAVFGPDRRQAKLTFSYARGLLHSVPELEALIERETRETIDLSNGVTVEVITSSKAAPRGRSYAYACLEEAAFFPTDDSANPDVELRRAIGPALARVPGSLLAITSSPYAKRGILFDAWQRYHETAPPHVVFVHASTRELNPTFDEKEISRAFEEDAVSARTEYDAHFRSDIESFISLDVAQGCVVPDRHELPYDRRFSYRAFVDPSGGSRDSFTLAVAHDENGKLVLDATRERKPPFSPESVVVEFADFLKTYSIHTVTGDRYAGEWPREQFLKRGIAYEPSEKPKSDLYRDLLPLLNSGKVELLDDRRLVNQLVSLERRTARGGKDSIDHAPASHDDLINSVAGALVSAWGGGHRPPRARRALWG